VVVSPGGWVRRQLYELLSALFQAAAPLPPTVSQLLLHALFIAVHLGEPSHPPTPAGFVYLEFSWTPALSLFSSVGCYPPVTVAGLVYLEFAWGTAHPPLSGEVCHRSVTVTSLAHSKLTGGRCQTHLLWQTCLFTVHMGNCPLPSLWQVSYTSATVAGLVLPMLTGGSCQTHPFWQACLFSLHGCLPLLLSPELKVPYPL
jgi:hypothetical protein